MRRRQFNAGGLFGGTEEKAVKRLYVSNSYCDVLCLELLLLGLALSNNYKELGVASSASHATTPTHS